MSWVTVISVYSSLQTFTTLETITNANSAKQWLLKEAKVLVALHCLPLQYVTGCSGFHLQFFVVFSLQESDVAKHFVALSTNEVHAQYTIYVQLHIY